MSNRIGGDRFHLDLRGGPMRTIHALRLCASVIACWVACDQVRAQQQTADAPAYQLAAPEMILQFKERLKLSLSQRDAIQALIDSVKDKLPALQQRHKTESQALRDKLQLSVSDEKAVLSQLDKVIVQERNIRRLQLALVIRAHNRLNAQQQAELEKIKVEVVNQRRALQQRIQSKLERAQQLARQKAAEGSPPNDVVEMMKPFTQLLKEGKLQQAESLLDQALAKLAPDDGFDLFSDSDLFPE